MIGMQYLTVLVSDYPERIRFWPGQMRASLCLIGLGPTACRAPKSFGRKNSIAVHASMRVKSCYKTDCRLFDNVAKPIVFFFWQCCKTCFIVAVLQHRLCCKTSCVAKPHVLRISCPQHYMLFGSLLSSKILWPIILHNRHSEVVLQNRLLQRCCSTGCVAKPAV